MLNESKEVKTEVRDGREFLVGAVWKWGPGFAKDTPKQTLPSGSQQTRH
jgi:hypothetical protein